MKWFLNYICHDQKLVINFLPFTKNQYYAKKFHVDSRPDFPNPAESLKAVVSQQTRTLCEEISPEHKMTELSVSGWACCPQP